MFNFMRRKASADRPEGQPEPMSSDVLVGGTEEGMPSARNVFLRRKSMTNVMFEQGQKFAYMALVFAVLEEGEKNGWNEDGWCDRMREVFYDLLGHSKMEPLSPFTEDPDSPAEKDPDLDKDIARFRALVQADDDLCMADAIKDNGAQVGSLLCEHFLLQVIVDERGGTGYDARARTAVKRMAAILGVPPDRLPAREDMLCETLHRTAAAQPAEGNSKKDTSFLKKTFSSPFRMLAVGSAAVAGGALVGLTGGLAAPLVVAGAGGIAATLFGGGSLVATGITMLGTQGGLAVVTGLFGATGASLTGKRMANLTKGIKEFELVRVSREEDPHLNVCITISGWTKSKADFTRPWTSMPDQFAGEHYTLVWESKELAALGNAIENFATSQAMGFIKGKILSYTILAPIMAGLAWPMTVLKAGQVIDNPWSVAMLRGEKCGVELAERLMAHHQGNRPVSLVGYSLGARSIYFCLKHLASKKAYGLIENVFLIGAPVQPGEADWKMCRRMVSGRLVNAYCKRDWILGFLYRSTSLPFSIAGLNAAPEGTGVESVDISKISKGHLSYRHPEKVQAILTALRIDSGSRVSAVLDRGDLDDDALILSAETSAATSAASSRAHSPVPSDDDDDDDGHAPQPDGTVQ